MDKASKVMLKQVLSALSHMQSLDAKAMDSINKELLRIQKGEPVQEKKPCSGCGKKKAVLKDLKDLEKGLVNAQIENTSIGQGSH